MFRVRSDCKYSLLCVQHKLPDSLDVRQGKLLQSLTFLVKMQQGRAELRVSGDGECVFGSLGVEGLVISNISINSCLG